MACVALWILAAQWELENTDTVASARSIMQRGLRFNAESQKLWQEYFRMELIATDRVSLLFELVRCGCVALSLCCLFVVYNQLK